MDTVPMDTMVPWISMLDIVQLEIKIRWGLELTYISRAYFQVYMDNNSLVPRPCPAFHRLQYGNMGRAWEWGYRAGDINYHIRFISSSLAFLLWKGYKDLHTWLKGWWYWCWICSHAANTSQIAHIGNQVLESKTCILGKESSMCAREHTLIS